LVKIKMRELAFARSGDKGDTSDVSLFVYDERFYDVLKRVATVDRVKEQVGQLVKGKIIRYELPNLGALKFFMKKALEGGATRTLALDYLGKTRSSLLLDMEIEVDEGTANEIVQARRRKYLEWYGRLGFKPA
jgi:hypothetical protein